MNEEKKPGQGTRLIHPPLGECEHTGAVSVPVYMVSTFKQDAPGKYKHSDYSRTSNPTRDALEAYIADLEGARAGFAFASGMAAISSCLMIFSAGDNIVATEDLYGGAYRVFVDVFSRLGITHTFVDTTDAAAVEAAIRPETKALYIESPTNPLLRIADIARLADIAHARGLLLLIDNTFASPLLQNPHALGADVVIHSATKYLGGHSDLIMGLATACDAEIAKRIKFVQNAVGAVASPMDSWLMMRGMKTLKPRMLLSQENAEKVARWLAGRPEIERVCYPGLESHPGYEIHKRQARGPGAVVSFYTKEAETACRIMDRVRLWTLAVSLGSIESLISYPIIMTHNEYSESDMKRLGINDRLIRLSLGIEDAEDLIADLEQAMG
jgi:cystathionine gamma-lyase/homocysteine desulfhydrase